MKITMRYLKLSGGFDRNGKEKMNKELEKFLLYSNKTIMQNILKYIKNDLSTKQVQKFVSIKSFEKVFKDKEYQCVVKFVFNTFGDMTLEIVRFGKRDMYKEMESQQTIKNFDKGIIEDDNFIF